MIFEAAGLGTDRYDAVNALGPPDAIVVARTRLTEADEINAFAKDLLQSCLTLWGEMAIVRVQIYADQAADSCFVTVLTNNTTEEAFAASALSAYRAVHHSYRTKDPQPPITHEVCFLPHGSTVQYQGRD